MGIVSWIVLGTIMGFLANLFVPGRFPGGVLGTVAGGMAGAFLGGALFSLIADRGVAGFDVVSLLTVQDLDMPVVHEGAGSDPLQETGGGVSRQRQPHGHEQAG
jgi:uncharacterized membrane protein YeaQ/YmgE (transglycosylase-associated protein family)